MTPLDGLREALPDADVVASDGSDLDEAGRIAGAADVAIVVVGCTYERRRRVHLGAAGAADGDGAATPATRPPIDAPAQANGRIALGAPEQQQGFAAGGDRASLDLSAADQALIRAAAAANPATIVVLMGGSAIMVEGWHETVPAILMLWYPGMEGGRALADVLLGDANPTGRLPFAVPRDAVAPAALRPRRDDDRRTTCSTASGCSIATATRRATRSATACRTRAPSCAMQALRSTEMR